ncbi:alpha/beta fold hydrolase [Amycolatopsis nivea]
MTGIAAVEGNGARRVLVLHGWALDSGVWHAARALTDLSAFTYAYFDFPGYGVHRDVPPASGMDAMAESALAAADELGWDSFALLGHSMGGAAAIRTAIAAPDRVDSVVALTPVSAFGTPFDEEALGAFRTAWADPGPALAPLAPGLSDVQLRNIVTRNRTAMDQRCWDRYLDNWTGAAFGDALHRCEAPVTVCCGAEDGLVTADYLASTMAELRRGELLPIAGAGHYPMTEQTAATVRLWESALR